MSIHDNCRCWYCGGQLIWQSDYNYDEIFGEGEGIATILTCSSCGAEVQYSQLYDESDDSHNNKNELTHRQELLDGFIAFCEKESDVSNFDSPYGVSFDKMKVLSERMLAGCNACEHYKDYDYCSGNCKKYKKGVW